MNHNKPKIHLVVLLLSTLSFMAQAQQKIVSAGAAVTELLLALDQQSSLVAVDVTSELPAGIEKPVIGYHRQLSSEGILATGATQLIGSDEMGPQSSLEQLKRAGLTVSIVNTEPTPHGLLERIDQLAKLTDSQQQARALKAEVSKNLETLDALRPQKEAQKKVLFLLIHEGRAANVAGKETTPNEIIHLAGGINPAAEQLSAYRPLSNEALIEMQPDVVLVSGRSYQSLGGTDAILRALPTLAATPAGKNHQIITIDGHALVGGLGLKSLSEAKRINQLIYP
ncbi:heme/hemin ABC transporter substrate-binding protein [Vibrio olivae]|uniref:Hemin ABC transporter substrate-binding protein n=1 Tax=Vibrio olivae TaxID=1243002 RepID=A0ABV5HQZ4_9VIBR